MPNFVFSHHLGKIAILSIVLGVFFPLGLFLSADLSYPDSPWDASPPHFLAAIMLIPVAAIVSGHIAASQNRRTARAGLLLGYLGIAALPMVALLSRSPHLSDESSAVASLRTLSDSLRAYTDSHPLDGYPASLADLASANVQDPLPAWCIDHVLADGIKSGYRFTYLPRSSTGLSKRDLYAIYADPVRLRSPYTSRHFFVDETGVIRLRKGEKANAESETLQ